MVVENLGDLHEWAVARRGHARQDIGPQGRPGLVGCQPVDPIADVGHRFNVGKVEGAKTIDIGDNPGQIPRQRLDTLGCQFQPRKTRNPLDFARRKVSRWSWVRHAGVYG